MAGQKVKLTVPSDLVNTPLIWTMAKQFQVVPNLRRASVHGNRGTVEMELGGAGEEIERALGWLKDQGVRVETAEGESPQEE
jgi:hypothetical protein